MEFHNLMMNFLIGIIGGIFSSVIVSRVFLIITREDSLYQELRIIKERTFIFRFDVGEYISSIDEGNLVIGSKSELESRDKLKEKLFAYSEKCEQYIEAFDKRKADYKMQDIASKIAAQNEKRYNYLPMNYEQAKILRKDLGEIQLKYMEYDETKIKYIRNILRDWPLRVLALCLVIIAVIALV